MDSKELAKPVDFGTTHSFDSLLVVRHGKIVAEAYYARQEAAPAVPILGACSLGAYQLPKLLIFSRTQHEISTPFGHPNIRAKFPKYVTII